MSDLVELTVDSQTLRVTNRESEHREFKSVFEKESLWKYAQTIAAFANRDGGILFFGIKNKPRELLGITGDEPDELVFANFLREYFEPEIPFFLDTKKIHGKKLFYVLVRPSPDKPIICKKRKILQFREKGKSDQELLREGAIYYRYSSSNGEIKHPELKKILDDKVQKVFHSLVENITLINKVGYDRAAVVDASGLSGDNKMATVYITTETAKNMNWISKGRFSETEDEAEKAFYVVKEVEIRHGIEVEKQVPTDPSKTHPLTKTALTKAAAISPVYIDAVLWKLDILNNPQYHFRQERGKSQLHNFTEAAKTKILAAYPLDMRGRKENIKAANTDYSAQHKKTKVSKA